MVMRASTVAPRRRTAPLCSSVRDYRKFRSVRARRDSKIRIEMAQGVLGHRGGASRKPQAPSRSRAFLHAALGGIPLSRAVLKLRAGVCPSESEATDLLN